MADDAPTQRQREAAESEAMRIQQTLGFQVSREELTRLAEDAPDARAQVVAATVLEAVDSGTLDQLNLDPEAVGLLREAVETGGEPEPETHRYANPVAREAAEALDPAEIDAMICQGPLSEGTGGRIAYALEVLASAARPDIFEVPGVDVSWCANASVLVRRAVEKLDDDADATFLAALTAVADELMAQGGGK